MGCLKIVHTEENNTPFLGVWKNPDIEKTGGSWYDYGARFYDAQQNDFQERFSFKADEIDFNYGKSTKTKGLVTTTIIRIIPTIGMSGCNTDEWQINLLYYDKYGNLIQSIRNIAFNGTEIVSNKYNFTRQLVAYRNNHLHNSAPRSTNEVTSISELQTFKYDHAGRPLTTSHKLNNDSTIGLTANVYDELGKLATKKLHKPSSELKWGQSIEYNYNIRGWLTDMNNDLFSQSLGYNNTQATPQYNGNISEMLYSYTGYAGKYLYSYDRLNRISAAQHPIGGNYSTNYSYDLNGNIISLSRGNIDNLSYTYKGNQIMSVNDQDGDQFQNNGFSDNGSFETTEYFYDNNGNMTHDLNKNILGINYNYLNLPENINAINHGDFINILYQYDATGTKRVKQTRVNGRIMKTTNYIGNFVYENGELKYVLTSEGRIVPQNGKMVYQYFIKDHLGNTRVMFDENNLVLQSDNYYPFGMRITETSPARAYDYNRYLFNGKELQDDFGLDWYDYGARFYDPQIGRWFVPDPLAESSPAWSPYRYAFDNPVSIIDPNGMSEDWALDKNKKVYWDNKATSQATTKEGETYLGKNAVVEEGGAADKNGNVKEGINEATISLYTPDNKEGPTATMQGNTIPADENKYATVAAQIMDGVKTTYKGSPAIKLNGGSKVATTKINPNPKSDYYGQKFANKVYIHAGNENYERLTTSRNKPISTGCQTGENGNRPAYLKFMKKVPAQTHIKVVLKRKEQF